MTATFVANGIVFNLGPNSNVIMGNKVQGNVINTDGDITIYSDQNYIEQKDDEVGEDFVVRTTHVGDQFNAKNKIVIHRYK